MNENNSKGSMMYQTEPAVAALNKVPNFDPLKYLRRAKNILKLDLPVQKLWFRLAYPNGPMQLKALRITEQMAIFEARIFLDRSDVEPISVSVVQRTAQDSKNYIKEAQDEALSQALSDAGFGIQFADVGMNSDLRSSVSSMASKSSIQQEVLGHPIKQAKGVKREGQSEVSGVQNVTEEARPANNKPSARSSGKVLQEKLPVTSTELPVESKKEVPAEYNALPVSNLSRQYKGDSAVQSQMVTMPVNNQRSTDGSEFAPQQKSEDVRKDAGKEENHTAVPAYTPDMPVEEILKQMTYEEAQAVVVDEGACKGETIAQVAKRRAVSLRFYLTPGNRSKNNIVRAAAKIVLDAMAEQKAG